MALNNFIIYDLIFLAIFIIAVILFIKTRTHNLARQGILYIYRTQLGIKSINWTSQKFKKILKPLQYVIVASGFTLMIGIVWLLGKTLYIYLTDPLITQVIKAPPIAPLIPYFPTLFKLDSFFPPFYFTYFIIAIIIVAFSHEFAHGVFARLNNVKILSTGVAFLGPFLGAFVEQDDKQMQKAKKFPQMAILAAGTFANVIMTILFGLLLIFFFTISFAPAGVHFNSYSTTVISIDNSTIPDIFSLEDEYIKIKSSGETYYARPHLLKQTLDNNLHQIIVFEDSPAFNAKLTGAITSINGRKTSSLEELSKVIKAHSPGEEVTIQTIQKTGNDDQIGKSQTFVLQLGEKEDQAFLGIGFHPIQAKGVFGSLYNLYTSIKNPLIHYYSSLGEFGWFIYFLLWWIVLINILVALFNMIPVGIFDGGRFFYLTIWGLTGNEKLGKHAFKISTWALILLFILLMVKWVFSFL